jgi:hypothetical protein
VHILRNASGIPLGMVTPRSAIDEWLNQQRRVAGQEFLMKRLKQIKRHLVKCYLPGCPVSLLDLPMKSHEFDAVVDEAWKTIQAAEDPIKGLIREMAAEGRA